jgi:alpha-1,2-mannosyltransferase
MEPSGLQTGNSVLVATLAFALGGILGWPFALALSIPFIFEQLFIYGRDRVAPENYSNWLLARWTRLFKAGLMAALLFVS